MQTLMLALIFLIAAAAQTRAACACGPDFCLDDSRHKALLDAKKSQLRRDGAPSSLIALLDRDGACIAAVERGPDGFSLRTVRAADGAMTTSAWSAQAEQDARQALSGATLRAFYMFNVSRRLACCGQPSHDKQPDWDASLDLNRGLVIACTRQGSAVSCR